MKRLIIDTDPGIDDAQAITMALKSHDLVEVVAFTTCHGNVDVHQASTNLQHILKANNRTDIPLFSGANCSLVGGRIAASHYHGNDGLGDAQHPHPPDVEIQSEHAVPALIRLVNENKGKLTLVCLAPLTNIALAIRLDPDFGKKLKDCVIMGGNYKGKGNITASAEFNFLADPEAARVVLRELRCEKTTMVTWELCIKHSFTWEWYEKFINTDSDLGRFFKKIESKTLATYYSDVKHQHSYVTCDPVAMAIAIDPEVIRSSERLYCDVELTGELTRGQVVVDWKGSRNESPNLLLVKDVDFKRYGDLLMLVVKDTPANVIEANHHWQPDVLSSHGSIGV